MYFVVYRLDERAPMMQFIQDWEWPKHLEPYPKKDPKNPCYSYSIV
jgi:hypothetical protein